MWQEWDNIKKEYQSLQLHDVIDYEKFCTISIVWHSTKIEGLSLSETDTRVLLEHDITAAGKPLSDHLMVKDHFAAFEYMKQEARRKRKVSIEFIQELGAMVMKQTGGVANTIGGSFDSSKGDLRLVQVYVDQKYFPNYQKVPRLLQGLCEAVNERIDQVKNEEILKLAADIHYNFVNIHPFGDGNGRTGRLLMNYIQFYHQEPPIKIFTEDRATYIHALNEAEAQNDLEVFRAFILQQHVKFLSAEIDKYRNLNKGFLLMF